MEFLNLLLIFVISYLLGSLPYGLVLVKVFKKVDIRAIGSKNIGTTNVLRAGYPILAFLTLLCDALKGTVAVLIFRYGYTLDIYNLNSYILAGSFAILGHIYPIWLNFKGGKGVAVALGTIIAINPSIGILAILTWLMIAFCFHYSSLAAIITFTTLPLITFFIEPNITIYIIPISVLILYKHRDNMVRLLKKEETKINLKKK